MRLSKTSRFYVGIAILVGVILLGQTTIAENPADKYNVVKVTDTFDNNTYYYLGTIKAEARYQFIDTYEDVNLRYGVYFDLNLDTAYAYTFETVPLNDNNINTVMFLYKHNQTIPILLDDSYDQMDDDSGDVFFSKLTNITFGERKNVLVVTGFDSDEIGAFLLKVTRTLIIND